VLPRGHIEGNSKMPMSFVKTGAAAQKLVEHNQVKQETRRLELNKAFRFFLKQGEERKILFVDGKLDQPPPNGTGMLSPGRVYEHYIFYAGKHMNLVCPHDNDPGAGLNCPLCDSGDNNALINLLTAIDLTPYTTKEKKTIPFTRKLFAFKHNVFEMLNAYAQQYGGLAGRVFKVKRVGEKSERVGDVFMPLGNVTDVAKAKQQFTRTFKFKKDGKEETKTVCLYEPLDYDAELTYKTADEMHKMGIGAPGCGSFQKNGTPVVESEEAVDVNEFTEQM
jgi:hypothetical protein